MEIKKKLTGEATAEQIAGWKAKYGEVFQITVDDSTCYLRKPDRQIYRAISTVSQSDPIKGNEILLDNCWLGGDEAIKKDDDKFFGVSGQLAGLITVKQAELKKL